MDRKRLYVYAGTVAGLHFLLFALTFIVIFSCTENCGEIGMAVGPLFLADLPISFLIFQLLQDNFSLMLLTLGVVGSIYWFFVVSYLIRFYAFVRGKFSSPARSGS